MISLLYVDDDPSLLDLCRIFLEREGDISVVTISSVNEALGRISTGQFDAIISDYQMPEIDGITFLRKIRQQHPDMPFLLFTGRGREEVVIEAINSGADSYVQKGGDPRSQFKELSHRVRQIVRRRKAETELRLMKFSVDHASEGIIWMKINGVITYYNDAICAMLGYTSQEFSGLSVSDVRPGLSYYSLSDGWNKLLTQKYATVEEILVKKDGSLLPVELVLNYNEQGSESLIFAFVRDISERRRSEGELKKAFHQLMVTEDGLRQQFEEIKKSDDTIRTIGQRYQMLSEEIDAWIWEISFDGRLINASAQVQDILGYRPGELVGKTFSDLLAPSDSARIASGLTGLIAKKEEFRSLLLPVVHRNGRELTLELTGMPVRSRDGSFYGFYGIAREVSSRNPAVAPQDVCMTGYSSLLEQAGDAIFISDAETGMLIDANQKALLLVKRTLPEILTMQEYALHPENGEERQIDQNLPQSREDSEIAEQVIVDRDGKRVPVIVSTKMLHIGERNLRIGIYHDISDLLAIRETLQEKTSELDRFFTTGLDLLCILDAGGRILRLNPAGKVLLGCDTRAVSALTDIIHPDDIAATRTMLQHLGRGGKTVTFVNRITNPDGSCCWIEWRAFMSGRKHIYAVARDLTEQKKVEQALSVANHKLNLLTDLTRHDIGNKLTILTGYFDLFRNCPGEPYFSMYIEKINETVAAISAQVEFTRIYQNLGMSAPGWINVHDLFCKVCRQREVPDGSVSSVAEGWEIFTDPLIDRVFFTLVDNAFRYGATLTKIGCTAYETQGYLVVVIDDNGIGIAQDDKERIFEKEWGRGAAGHSHNLFLAREILSITGITIYENGKAGKGARFEICVPKGTYRKFVPDPGSCSGQVRVPDFISQTHHNQTL